MLSSESVAFLTSNQWSKESSNTISSKPATLPHNFEESTWRLLIAHSCWWNIDWDIMTPIRNSRKLGMEGKSTSSSPVRFVRTLCALKYPKHTNIELYTPTNEHVQLYQVTGNAVQELLGDLGDSIAATIIHQ